MGDSFLIFGFQECPDNCPPVRVWFRVRDKMGWGRGGNFETKLHSSIHPSKLRASFSSILE